VTDQDGKGLQIMVIDDDPDDQEFMRDALTALGHEVLGVTDSMRGFALAVMSPPDLIFLDLMIPDVNGLATMKMLREESKTSDIPIILMSSAPELGTAVLAAVGGAVEFMPKDNINEKYLSKRIEGIQLDLKR